MAVQRTARLATIALLVAGAVTTISLVVWSFYIRATAFDERLGRASLRSGLELAARLNSEYLAGLAALAAAALALAYVIWREPKPWAYLATALGSAVTIAGVWWGRAIVMRLEDPHFVKKSPWVKAATFVATSATIFLALLCVTATVAWLSQRRQAAKA